MKFDQKVVDFLERGCGDGNEVGQEMIIDFKDLIIVLLVSVFIHPYHL